MLLEGHAARDSGEVKVVEVSYESVLSVGSIIVEQTSNQTQVKMLKEEP